jgi:hypothetical protein
MKPTPVPCFILGAALAAAAWIALYPRLEEHTHPPVADVQSPAPSWTLASFQKTLHDLNAAQTSEQKLAAVTQLNEIPIEDIPVALQSIETVKNRQLTFAARMLLIRWGSKDGPAAMAWAWEHLGKNQAWNEAFGEIGPAWAWRDPEGFGKWIKAAMDRQTPGLSLSPEIVKSAESPVFDMSQISKASRWLVTGKPSVALEILKLRPGWVSDDHQIVDLLQTVEQVREALLAFDEIDRIDPMKPSIDQALAMSVLSRWKQLDPGDFARSPYRTALAITKFEEIDGVVASWKSVASGERAAKANTAINGSDPMTRDYTISKIAKEWLSADTAGAAAWLESLPESDAKTRNRVFAAEVSIIDPDLAFHRIAALPSLESRASMAVAFDTWQARHPDQLPDMSEWSAELRRNWMDLEAIRTR